MYRACHEQWKIKYTALHESVGGYVLPITSNDLEEDFQQYSPNLTSVSTPIALNRSALLLAD